MGMSTRTTTAGEGISQIMLHGTLWVRCRKSFLLRLGLRWVGVAKKSGWIHKVRRAGEQFSGVCGALGTPLGQDN